MAIASPERQHNLGVRNLAVENKLFLGSWGSATQSTSKSTGVTLNTKRGQITMNNAALSNGVEVTFTVTNSECHAGDVPNVCRASGGTANSYLTCVDAVAEGSFDIIVSNASGGSLSEAVVINFVII